jgi:hypothetical protein
VVQDLLTKQMATALSPVGGGHRSGGRSVPLPGDIQGSPAHPRLGVEAPPTDSDSSSWIGNGVGKGEEGKRDEGRGG